MNSDIIVSGILNPSQLENLEELAGMGWTKRDLALYFGIHLTRFLNECDNGEMIEGTIKYHYERGITLRRAAVDIELSSTAEGGNLTAIQIYKKEMEKSKLTQFKEDLLNGLI